MPRDLILMFYVSLPFWAAAGGLFVAGEFFSSGWDGLTRVIYGAIILGAWAALMLGWCGWVVLRDGLVASSLVPGAVLVAAAIGAGIWAMWFIAH